jgi:hypothetical protein
MPSVELERVQLGGLIDPKIKLKVSAKVLSNVFPENCFKVVVSSCRSTDEFTSFRYTCKILGVVNECCDYDQIIDHAKMFPKSSSLKHQCADGDKSNRFSCPNW